MPQWRGWSSCLQRGLQAVRTPFVMVLQDDRPFVRAFGELPALLGGMTRAGDEAVGYVLLPTVGPVPLLARHSTAARPAIGAPLDRSATCYGSHSMSCMP